jgi:hypothetical protein
VQIVDYDTGAGEGSTPALLVAEDGTVDREPLPAGRALAYSLGERRCAGVTDGGEHLACDAPTAPRCERHDSTWICARCRGTCLKAEMDCYQTHAIYLAAFAPSTFKVGVTRRSDPAVRLREQGADRGVVVRRVANGRIAREIEADIAASTPLPDSVPVSTKIEGMARDVDENGWNDLLSAFDPVASYDLEYGLDPDAAPIPETIAAGTVRGTKGRVLVLERNGEQFAVDLRSLVGHEIEPGADHRQLQSSLGSFG